MSEQPTQPVPDQPEPAPEPTPVLEPVEVATTTEAPAPEPQDGPPGAKTPQCGRHYVARIAGDQQKIYVRGTHILDCTLPYGHGGEHGQAAS